MDTNNSKRAYQLVKDLTSEKQGRSTTIQDKSGKCLTDEQEIFSRWTELYNHESYGDNAVLREKVVTAVVALKQGKSVGVDNIPVVQTGGETIIDV